MTKSGLRFAAAAAWGLFGTPAFAGMVYTYDDVGRLKSVTYDSGYQITYSYDDAGNRTQVVSQLNGNHPPVANPDAVTILESAPSITFDPRVNDTDADGDAIKVVAPVTGAVYGTATVINNGTAITYTPSTKRSQVDVLSYQIQDTNGGTGTANITVTLANENPVAVNDAVTVTRNSSVTFDPRTNDSDPGNDAFSITGTSTPSKGSVSILSSGTQLKYTPVVGNSGADSFTYTITDVDGGTATGTVSMAISTANQVPLVANDSMTLNSTYSGTPFALSQTIDPRVNDSDPDHDPFTITAVTQGTKGQVAITNSGTTVTYTINVSHQIISTDTFTYTVTDSMGGTATATVNVSIDVESNN